MFLVYSSLAGGLLSGVLIWLILLAAGLSPVSDSPLLEAIVTTILLASANGLYGIGLGAFAARFVLPRVSLAETASSGFVLAITAAAATFTYHLWGRFEILVLVLLAAGAGGFSAGVILRRLEDDALAVRKTRRAEILQAKRSGRSVRPPSFD